MSSSSSAEAAARPPLRVALLGSTGSIGRQAVDVIERDATFKVVAITGGRNAAILGEQARRLRPEVVVLGDPAARHGLGELPAGTRLAFGDAALEAVAGRPDLDLLVVGTGGMVSLRPVLAALRAGTAVATANKETLVAGGHLVMPLARDLAAAAAGTDGRHPLASTLGWVRPIDSEHSAIWQCLAGEDQAAIARLILTASGGPFLDLDADALRDVTADAALRHPTWRMGSKITIDSATLANKGLEVIEAHWLYDAPYEAIDVVIHPQSVIHSAVQFVDGSLKAQLGTPDMRLPIQYALTYPERRPSPAAAPDLVEIGRLEFRAPDETRFPALRIARDAGRAGPWATAALIAADEVAVARFLDGSLDFAGIPRLLAAAVERFGTGTPDPGVEDLVALEAEIRSTYAARVVD
ncbi:MAG TPA: 1-deoxy-D-xylulose-5-phosphate reductoisomerase [Candidatus Limnocylindrales bacterium]|nr:1-deoxy-D-xylulose-5-phosphate reductoisomerase [Candidatus Limnocylindrales bacterium]